MDLSVGILLASVVILAVVAWHFAGWRLVQEGLSQGWGLAIGVLPQLTLGFALAGLVIVLVPSDTLGRLVGADSGLLGLLIASAAGVATPGGPFIQFPLVAALASAGASPGPMAAYITAWSLISWNRVLVWELPLLGPQFVAIRLLASVIMPVVVGALTAVLYSLVERPVN